MEISVEEPYPARRSTRNTTKTNTKKPPDAVRECPATTTTIITNNNIERHHRDPNLRHNPCPTPHYSRASHPTSPPPHQRTEHQTPQVVSPLSARQKLTPNPGNNIVSGALISKPRNRHRHQDMEGAITAHRHHGHGHVSSGICR